MSSAAPLPPDETERLARLRELFILDSPPEAVFDELAKLASEVCGVPIALISLVDAERQWFKANVGLPGVNETPRDVAFCAHALGSDAVLEVPDATHDPRFADNPLVTDAPHIRFYAGAPLALGDGTRMGTLCVIDRQQRSLDAAQTRMLLSLARIATQALVMRRDLIHRSLTVRAEYEAALSASEKRYRAIVEDQTEMVSLARPDGQLLYVNPAYARHFGRTPQQMVGSNLFDWVEPGDVDRVRAQLALVLQTGESRDNENRMVAADGRERWVAWTNTLQQEAGQPPVLHSVGRDMSERKQLEHSLRVLTMIFDNTTDSVVQTDTRGRITYMNPAARRATGLGPDEDLSQRSFAEFNTPATNRHFAEVVVPEVRAKGVWLGETTVYFAGQREVPVSHMVIAHRSPDGRVERYSAVLRDISAQVEAKQQLARQSATLRSVIEAIPAIVAVVGVDGRYRFVNSAFERWRGQPREQIIGRTVVELLGNLDYERSRPWMERALAGEVVSFERDYATPAGAQHLALSYIPLWLEGGTMDGFVGVALDITQSRREESRLLQLAQRDVLTGLLNRGGFEQVMEHRLEEQGGAALALLYIDLDHFKPVNDAHGHPVGDEVLKLFAQRLSSLVRPTDAVARLGGDEFALLLSGVRTGANAQAVAHKVVEAARAPFKVGPLQLHIGASVGVAFGVDPEQGWADLVARADGMLYRAKAAGRGRLAGEAGEPGTPGAP